MTDYKRCPTCGAICTVEGKPDFIGDEYPVTMHYVPACDALVRDLATLDLVDLDTALFNIVIWRGRARDIVEAIDG